MESNYKRIANARIGLVDDSKYNLGKSKKEIKQRLEVNGTKVVSCFDEHDITLLGKKHQSLHYIKKDAVILFDRELINTQITPLEQKTFSMIRNLIKMENITIDWLELGEGLTEKQLVVLEKKLKSPIPKALKDFYSVFGHVKLLWHFNNPPVKGRQVYTGNSLYIHSGQHDGCINILPLKKVLFENWKDSEYYFNFPEGKNIVLFDLYSNYHILGFNLSETEDPEIYLGEDHGVSFDPIKSLNFTTYIKMLLGIYGYTNRFTDTKNWIVKGEGYIFDLSTIVDKPDKNNIKASFDGFVHLNTSNTLAIEKYKEQTWSIIHRLIEEKEFEKALNNARILSKYDTDAFGVMLDIWVINEDEEMFFKGLAAFFRKGFNIKKYEKETKQTNYFATEKYKNFVQMLSEDE